jgi:hypothetical protein
MTQHVMKTHLEEEVCLRVFLTSLPDGNGWSNSLIESFTFGKTEAGTR